ncbi:MAG: hypothetical protein IPJ40_16515 [Saprospirales bacterium]|nr:hypothetical protein [Saprospirales bacterium]
MAATTEDLSGIAAGTFSVTVTATSSGCTATTTVTVTNNNPAINIAGNTNPVTSCTTPNGSIDITITPSNTYTFIWSNGATTEDLVNIAAGTYSVTVSAGGKLHEYGHIYSYQQHADTQFDRYPDGLHLRPEQRRR